MSYELFKREIDALDQARTFLDDGKLKSQAAREEFESLLGSYQKLFKQTKRLVRISDRSEAELNRVLKSLDEKNAMLEGLSQSLSKYLSPQIYDVIFSGERDVAINTERKKLTVFFSDIKDFTSTTDGMEPEDLTALLNHYLTEMSAIALEYGATIDKYIGDAMVMFFGDPTTMGVKEDAIACVKMAMDMQRRMRDLQEEWRDAGYEKPFRMRIGINTGYCNVGNFGSDARMDYTIIGGEVNLAARLEGIGEPDGLTMSYETYALVRDFVDAEEGDPITVKGINRPVRPYFVKNIIDEADAERRFIRREEEGLRILLDLEKLGTDDRKRAIKDMQGIIKRLKA